MNAYPHEGAILPLDEKRGTWGMAMFIATEALLFVVLFFAYGFLSRQAPAWPPEPPKLKLALIMLAVLLTSSGVLFWGEKSLEAGAKGRARLATGLTILLGVGFLVLQGFEYHDRLKEVKPTSDAYGSIFYTITSIHGFHVLFGVLMLAFVLLLPTLTPDRTPHRPLHHAALYWHFVDFVWIVIVATLYVAPHLKG